MSSLRQAMPLVTAFIDTLRDQFDVDGQTPVHDAIKTGINGGGTFYACENGQEIGAFANRHAIPLSECVVGLPDVSGASQRANKAGGRA